SMKKLKIDYGTPLDSDRLEESPDNAIEVKGKDKPANDLNFHKCGDFSVFEFKLLQVSSMFSELRQQLQQNDSALVAQMDALQGKVVNRLTEERLKNQRLEHTLNQIIETLHNGNSSTIKEELQLIVSRIFSSGKDNLPNVEENPQIRVDRGVQTLHYFPILGLPNETIIHILAYLHLKDRLNVRVNRRISRIESEMKYELESLTIKEGSRTNFEESGIFRVEVQHLGATLYNEITPLLDMSRIFFERTNVEKVDIKFCGSCRFRVSAFLFIRNFDHIGLLALSCESMADELPEFELFLTFLASSKMIQLWNPINIHWSTLYHGFQQKFDGSLEYRSLSCYQVKEETILTFLRHYGITRTNGTLYSSRNIEAFRNTPSGHIYWFYEGLLAIQVIFHRSSPLPLARQAYGRLIVTSFKDQESVDAEKYRRLRFGRAVRVNVVPQ
ncbi:hypothetical protein PMAYCL1PPCAC_00490, partial [Pristionchus mayeri]